MRATETRPVPVASRERHVESNRGLLGLFSHRIDSLKIVTLPARLFLALGWFRAGVEKLIDTDWWVGTELQHFLALQRPHALTFMHAFIDNVIAPFPVFVAVAVMIGQLALGLAFFTGRHLGVALSCGLVLNTVFIAMGVVSPSVFYFVLQLTLLVAIGERHRNFDSWRLSVARVVVCLVAAITVLPFTRTLHPAEVVDDPALVLATLAMLCAAVDILRIAQVYTFSTQRPGTRWVSVSDHDGVSVQTAG